MPRREPITIIKIEGLITEDRAGIESDGCRIDVTPLDRDG